MLVQGIHHVCIRCEKSEIEKVKEFYPSVLDSRRICIVASGNFDFEKLIALLNRKFSNS